MAGVGPRCSLCSLPTFDYLKSLLSCPEHQSRLKLDGFKDVVLGFYIFRLWESDSLPYATSLVPVSS